MLQVLLAVFWAAIGIFLLAAPDDVFRSSRPMVRRAGATACFIAAAVSLLVLAL